MAIRVITLILLIGAGFALGRLTASTDTASSDLPIETSTKEPASAPMLLPNQPLRSKEGSKDPGPKPRSKSLPTGSKSTVDEQALSELVRVPHGTLKVYYEKGRYVLKPEGHWINYAGDGTKLNEGHYLNGVLHGEYTSWYRDGQIAGRGTYAHGKEDGVFTTWYPNGKIHVRADHKAGRYHGEFESFHKNGNQKEATLFRHGKRHGPGRTWHENGELHQQGVWQDGKRLGEWDQWDAKGEMK